MEELLVKRRTLKRRLTLVKNKLDSHGNEPLDIHDVDLLSEQIAEIWSEFNQLSEDIIAACDEEEEDTHELALNEMSERCYSIKKTLRLILAELNYTGEVNTSNSEHHGRRGPASHADVPSVKLPKLDLPSFSGDLLQWTHFYDLFRSSVHNQKISGSQKLQYLKGCLGGEAEKLIQHYSISDANYQEAWNVLTKRYQNIRELVKTLIDKFNSQPYLTHKNVSQLRQLVDTSTSCILALKALDRKVSVDDDNDWVTHGIMSRLDQDTRELWESKLGREAMPKLRELLEFLDDRVRILGTASNKNQLNERKTEANNKRQISAHQTNLEQNCPSCNEGHSIYSCKEFAKMNATDKKRCVEKRHLCYNCLKPGHGASDCKSIHCKKCDGRHHTLLHLDKVNKPGDSNKSVTALTSSNDGTTTRALLATAMVKVTNQFGGSYLLRALLDPGADSSFVTERAVQLMNLQKQRIEVNLFGLSSSLVGTAKGIVKLTVGTNFHANFTMNVTAYVLKKVTGILPKLPTTENETAHLKGLHLADPNFGKPGKIDLLLGSDVFFEALRSNRVVGEAGHPVAQETVWGYIVGGSCPSQSIHSFPIVNHVSLDDVDTTLRRFWEVEEVPRKHFLSPEETQCELHFVKTHVRKPDGRYVTELPFKVNAPALGESEELAIKRLKCMERRLQQKPELKQQYIKFMREYEDLGHMSEVSSEEVKSSNQNIYYLPHHPVIKEDSSTTKLRVVFDASAKSSNRMSLNDVLMTGPKLQDDIFELLIRFRFFKIPLKADICKMFRQIEVAESHRDFQRIVWRESSDVPIKHYRLNTVTYGTSCAPYLAKRVLQQLCVDEADNLPVAAKVAANDIYMDDLVSGEFTLPKALSLQKNAIELLKRGGFDLRKWSSSYSEILESVSPDMREIQVPLSFDESDSIKALGIRWHPTTDLFQYKVSLSPSRTKVTKRTIASDVAKIYDPMGWLTPVTITFKILLQSLWKTECDWDDDITDEFAQQWFSYRSSLHQLEVIRIPRCIYPQQSEFMLLGFSDASEKAYSAVVYIGVIEENNMISTNILASKSKVAPIKQISLPRLELNGAVLLVHLLESINDCLKKKPMEIHAWTDSTIVLSWLRSSPQRWATFVANRVAEIQSVVPYSNWHHVPGTNNPADCASRGIDSALLQHHPLWWNGPGFLHNYPYCQSQVPFDENSVTEEKKCVTVHHNTTEEHPLLYRYSSLHKLMRIAVYCFRFVANCKNKRIAGIITGPPTAGEMKLSLLALIRVAQLQSFGEELKSLSTVGSVLKGKIATLSPFLDSRGLMRVGGRLIRADLPQDIMHPILLPKKHKLTELIIRQEHLINLHAGTQLLLATIQRKYWIMGARDIIGFWIRKCIVCTRHKAQMLNQRMADLPSFRVIPCRPFLKTGVDYSGPFMLRSTRGHDSPKCYIVIFVCMVTTAIHIELVESLSTTAFIDALMRFVSRRGRCTDVFTDCGRNFVGAEKELKFMKAKAHLDQITSVLSEKEINFHFNPPGSPHFGGLWEAGIKSIKFHFKRVIGNTKLNYPQMLTLLTQIEACLNSRPMSALSSDPEILQPLTPGHFLIGDALTAIPEPDYATLPMSSLTRFQLRQKLVQAFWKRWSKEYLTRLQQRPKWWTTKTNLDIGDLVLINDERQPPMKWKMGRVIELHPGKDSLVRVASLKTAEGIIKRPIVKLCLLPIPNDSEN